MSLPTAFDIISQSAPTLSVGILPANLLETGKEVRRLESSTAVLLHFDVMDGNFCPALTFGPPLIKAIKTRLLKDVHLMIVDPLEKLPAYVDAGADIITLHLESAPDLGPALELLGRLPNRNDPERGIVGGIIRGIALNPGTLPAFLAPLLDRVEMVTLLAVRPGLSGQRFDPSTPERLLKVREMIAASGRDILVGLDGGITRDNIREVAKLGADVVVAGSAVFKEGDPVKNTNDMIEALHEAQ